MEVLAVVLKVCFCIVSLPTAAYTASSIVIISDISWECFSILEWRPGLIAYLEERDNYY